MAQFSVGGNIQPDIRDPNAENLTRLIEIAAKLPVPKVLATPLAAPEEENVVISDAMEKMAVESAPHEEALGRLLARLAGR